MGGEELEDTIEYYEKHLIPLCQKSYEKASEIASKKPSWEYERKCLIKREAFNELQRVWCEYTNLKLKRRK
jgi:hypothetical protein